MKTKLFYFYNGGYVIDGSNRLEVSTIDRRGDYIGERVFIQELDVEVPDCEVPDRQTLNTKMAAILEEQKATILAETHIKVKRLDEKISQLLALPNLSPAEKGAE